MYYELALENEESRNIDNARTYALKSLIYNPTNKENKEASKYFKELPSNKDKLKLFSRVYFPWGYGMMKNIKLLVSKLFVIRFERGSRMDASIVIATYNRAVSLKRTLTSLERMEVSPEITWEVIVVDNNSKDGTKRAVEDFNEDSKLKVKYIFEKEQGKSYALNSGSKAANGEFLVYTDDDIVVHPNWLTNIVTALRSTHAACVGGKIHLDWEMPRPPWLNANLLGHLGYLDLGEEPIELSTRENYRDYGPRLYGANIAVKSSVAEKYGYFNTNMGPKAEKMYHAEDTHFIETLIQSGEDVYYIPDVIVNHCIPGKNIRKKYFRKRVFHQGESRAVQWGHYRCRNVLGTPLYIFNEFGIHAMKYLWLLITKPSETFSEEIQLSHYLGFFLGRYKFTKSLSDTEKMDSTGEPPRASIELPSGLPGYFSSPQPVGTGFFLGRGISSGISMNNNFRFLQQAFPI